MKSGLLNGAIKLKVNVGQQVLFARGRPVTPSRLWGGSADTGCHVLPRVV